ncbi:hypothetical protein LPJ61_003725 [Coemansia biformis]|uniref:Uncharacterized protein n=1 Tax=Coemansia biformis TaxID=1286918 RepID=A0A9W8CXY6_9FUNG|nr:hypothetical protein LPJ61_003725 [Coemansia biformis]
MLALRAGVPPAMPHRLLGGCWLGVGRIHSACLARPPRPHSTIRPPAQQQRRVWAPVTTGVAARRTYLGGPAGPPRVPWVKPALILAGGVVLTTVAWPLLRFVVFGALGYGAYRVVRAALVLRSLNRLARGDAGLWEQLQGLMAGLGVPSMAPVPKTVLATVHKTAETSLRAACAAESSVQQLVRADPDQIELGPAIDVQSETTDGRGTRMEAVFPVFVAGQGTAVFVQAVAASGTRNVDFIAKVDDLCVLARQPAGEVLTIQIAVTSDDARPRKPHVRDADYREL